MKVALLIAVHGRDMITSLCYDGVDRVKKAFQAHSIDLIPYIVCSSDYELERANLRRYKAMKHRNRPLGEKMNGALRWSMMDDWDYLMQLGSDDLITKSGVDVIASKLNEGSAFFGFTGLYVVEAQSMQMKEYHGSVVFGAGRCIRRDVLELTTNQNHGRLWDDRRERAMDLNSQSTIKIHARVVPEAVHLDKPVIVDIKTGDNINPFNSFRVDSIPMLMVCPELKWLKIWNKKNPDLLK